MIGLAAVCVVGGLGIGSSVYNIGRIGYVYDFVFNTDVLSFGEMHNGDPMLVGIYRAQNHIEIKTCDIELLDFSARRIILRSNDSVYMHNDAFLDHRDRIVAVASRIGVNVKK